MNIVPPITLYPITNYAFGSKEAGKPKLDGIERLKLLEKDYNSKGLITTVEACILVHDHSHPHVLLMRGEGSFSLPGGDLAIGQEEEEGLLQMFVVQSYNRLKEQLGSPTDDESFEIGELVAMFYRPHFQDQMVSWHAFIS
jgi:cleavage and polyadenylation specificity factor subunit 5